MKRSWTVNMLRIYPVNSCRECPKFQEIDNERKCLLSNAQAYDLDEDWEEYLEQFCPLSYLEMIMEDAYEMGKLFKELKDDKVKEVKKSIDGNKWCTAHEYLDKIKMN